MRRIIPLLAIPALLLLACMDRTPTTPVVGPEVRQLSGKAKGTVQKGQDRNYEVGFTTFMVHDAARSDRPIPVYVWYPVEPSDIDGSTPEAIYPLFPFDPSGPTAPSSAFVAKGMEGAYQEPPPADGPFPLIMYSPGWHGTAYNDGHFIATGLARRGFVVAGLTHWGDQATGNLSEPYDHLALASFNRPQDVSRALDALLAKNTDEENLLFSTMDPGKIVATGWSLGGYAAMVLAGGDDQVCDLADIFPGWPVPPETCAPNYPDTRISKIIPVDGSNQLLHFYELARVAVPAMGIGEEWNAVGPWQARQHAAFSGHPAYRVDVFGTAHLSFSSACDTWPIMKDYGAMPGWLADWLMGSNCSSFDTDRDEVQRLVLKYMLAFLNHDQRVLTPGNTVTSEPLIEFFVTEKRNPSAIDEDWPDIFTYFMHQPGKAHANAYEVLSASAEKDPLGSRPMEFVFRRQSKGGF